jgi:presenilin-like A22 family membrane protease
VGRKFLFYLVALVLGIVAGLILGVIHARLAEIHPGLPFLELGVVAVLFVASRIRRRRRRLEASPRL